MRGQRCLRLGLGRGLAASAAVFVLLFLFHVIVQLEVAGAGMVRVKVDPGTGEVSSFSEERIQELVREVAAQETKENGQAGADVDADADADADADTQALLVGSSDDDEDTWLPVPDGEDLSNSHVRLDKHTGRRYVKVSSTTEEGDDEWRPVVEGRVPRGSHVRIDMRNGKKWVKVEKKDEEKIAAEKQQKNQFEAEDMIVDVLASLPEPNQEAQVLKAKRSSMSSEEYRAAAKRLWELRQKELKKAMESIVDHAKEMEKDLRALDESNSQDAVSYLTRLEDFVGDVDNAGDFVAMGGFDTVLKYLRDDDTHVRAAAAYVLGSAVKHNREFKLEAARKHFKVIADGLYARSTCTSSYSRNECRKALYAISSIMSGSDAAQNGCAKLPYYNFATVVAEVLSHKAGGAEVNPIVTRVANIVSDTYAHRVSVCSGNAPSNLLSEQGQRDGHDIGVLDLENENPEFATRARDTLTNECLFTLMSGAYDHDRIVCKAYKYDALWTLTDESVGTMLKLRSVFSMYKNYYEWQYMLFNPYNCDREEEGLRKMSSLLDKIERTNAASDPDSIAAETLRLGRQYVEDRVAAAEQLAAGKKQ